MDDRGTAPVDVSDRADDNEDALEDDDDEEALEHLSKYVPYESTNNTTLVRRGLQKRAPEFRGTMHMDCKKMREACQNACWYQNCVRDAQGDETQVVYTNARDGVAPGNRIQSGVTISRGTPCNAWPFGQRFWDTYPLEVHHSRGQMLQATLLTSAQKSLQKGGTPFNKNNLNLETDEWPMASWHNDPFDASKGPQVSLRCITNTDNSSESHTQKTYPW